MVYTLKEDGDDIEKKSWDLFAKNKFPNYEIFWVTYVVPKTNRPDNLFLKAEYSNNENVVFITQIHYSIIQHLSSIYDTCENKILDFSSFEYLYPKLSTIFDLTEDLLFRYLIELKTINLQSFLDKNGNIKSRKEDILKANISGENIKELYSLIQDIKKYRNKITHSWVNFHIFDKTYKQLSVPRKERLNDLRNWTEIYNKLVIDNDQNYKVSLFIDARELLLEDTNKLVNLLNLVWADILKIN